MIFIWCYYPVSKIIGNNWFFIELWHSFSVSQSEHFLNFGHCKLWVDFILKLDKTNNFVFFKFPFRVNEHIKQWDTKWGYFMLWNKISPFGGGLIWCMLWCWQWWWWGGGCEWCLWGSWVSGIWFVFWVSGQARHWGGYIFTQNISLSDPHPPTHPKHKLHPGHTTHQQTPPTTHQLSS